MISKNTITNSNKPFLLKPAGKDYLWGGQRLNHDFTKQIEMDPLAETWECSTHPDGPSIVASGEYAGKSLKQVLDMRPDFLGTHPQEASDLPILIKLIDAHRDLSVQVHPDDAYARTHESGARGKTELWYVLDATRDARLIYGFRRDMDKETVRRSIENGTIDRYLQKIPVKKDDIFYIPAGQVHAIGAGVLVAEVQENSNLTYRMYDYGRTDKEGNKRPLHVDKALECADLKGSSEPRQPMRVFGFKRGYALELLCRCAYFQAERMILNTERCRGMAGFATGENSFQVFLCTDGCGIMCWEEETLDFYKGDCVFVPASSAEIKMHGRAQFLKVSC